MRYQFCKVAQTILYKTGIPKPKCVKNTKKYKNKNKNELKSKENKLEPEAIPTPKSQTRRGNH